MKKKLIQNTSEHFEKLFQKKPEHIFLSPGRINIIGEHVDYNDGFVLPAAINKYICFAISKNENSECALVAKDLNEVYQFDLKDTLQPIDKMWVNYILGVLQQLKEKGLKLNGFTIVFSSTIPMGAGLSSSAALECGIAYAMNNMFDLNLSKEEIALIGQKAEHTFAGVNCGIMDQFASVFGKKNKVIKLDCTTLAYEYHKANFKEYQLVLFDSCVKHTHLTSGYNDRRNEVEQGLAIIKATYPEVTSFRNCTEKMVLSLKDKLGEIIFNRCLFVVHEIERVELAVKALSEGNIEQLGNLMTKTHYGLSELYEVSCPEMDFLVQETNNFSAIIGARMMGGGFGGCTINLVKKDNVNAVIEKMTQAYKTKYNIELKSYKIKIAKGTTEYAI
ncbi:galactokinase [Flavobacterium difficile]|uniref:Galactokinase n=1 Tax=Flavobacterium difficile TaxID=2709659 RepID=A0ABX0I3T6_9FLAO|nr:galactokinase [Flavobacterium difficile]NHM01837.1 galactokinase [Flavobacterium difficile]